MERNERGSGLTRGAPVGRGQDSSASHHHGDGNAQSSDDTDCSDQLSNTQSSGRSSAQAASTLATLNSAQLPRPQAMHSGWDPSNVSTAKCDMCHRQRCGVIQKCTDCKLSVCRDCAYANRLADDVRHVLDPTTVEWDSRTVPRGRGIAATRGPRPLGSIPQGSGHGRGQGEVAAEHPTASYSSATSFTATPSPQTDVASQAASDGWMEGHASAGGPQGASAQVIANSPNQSTKRTRSTASPSSAPVTQQAQDAAQILAGMPHGGNEDHDSSQKRLKYEHIPLSNILPPLRLLPDPNPNRYSLPPLSTLYPELSGTRPSEGQQSQVIPTGPQVAPTAFMSSDSAHDAPSYYQSHTGYAGNQYLAPHMYQNNYATGYYGHAGPASSYYPHSTLPTAQDTSYQQYANVGTQFSNPAFAYNGASQQASGQQYGAAPTQYTGNAYGVTGQYGDATYPATQPTQNAYGYGSLSQGQQLFQPMNHPAHMEPGNIATSTPGTHGSAAFPPAQAISQPRNMQRPHAVTLHDQLVEAARNVKRSEHTDWAMEFCLRLAVQRKWLSKKDAVANTPQLFPALQQLMLATDRAILELNLPETNNSARMWLLEEQQRISAPAAEPAHRLSMSNYCSNPPHGNAS
ncbi:Small ubiquitin-related modifier, SUMO [Purpureocillium lavendulum]|uniref:Small ubiquitin-related modifier, SUMO n=1 Tax=Purpureocillium lavendulum TaxID=1247861 RepID=A0AB34G2H2_9HYPO|nr:Small ubiquitin-related modifier, SUMO [Purpureocillium lavendulum]